MILTAYFTKKIHIKNDYADRTFQIKIIYKIYFFNFILSGANIYIILQIQI